MTLLRSRIKNKKVLTLGEIIRKSLLILGKLKNMIQLLLGEIDDHEEEAEELTLIEEVEVIIMRKGSMKMIDPLAGILKEEDIMSQGGIMKEEDIMKDALIGRDIKEGEKGEGFRDQDLMEIGEDIMPREPKSKDIACSKINMINRLFIEKMNNKSTLKLSRLSHTLGLTANGMNSTFPRIF
jgi:hypothetical protein